MLLRSHGRCRYRSPTLVYYITVHTATHFITFCELFYLRPMLNTCSYIAIVTSQSQPSVQMCTCAWAGEDLYTARLQNFVPTYLQFFPWTIDKLCKLKIVTASNTRRGSRVHLVNRSVRSFINNACLYTLKYKFKDISQLKASKINNYYNNKIVLNNKHFNRQIYYNCRYTFSSFYYSHLKSSSTYLTLLSLVTTANGVFLDFVCVTLGQLPSFTISYLHVS